MQQYDAASNRVGGSARYRVGESDQHYDSQAASWSAVRVNNSILNLVVLSPEWIAEVRSRCAAFAENPFAKRWGRSRDMLRQDAHFIPQLLDEIEKLQRHVAFLERSLVTSEKQVAKLSEELDCV